MDKSLKKLGRYAQKMSIEAMKREILGKEVTVPNEEKKPTAPKKYGRSGYGR